MLGPRRVALAVPRGAGGELIRYFLFRFLLSYLYIIFVYKAVLHSIGLPYPFIGAAGLVGFAAFEGSRGPDVRAARMFAPCLTNDSPRRRRHPEDGRIGLYSV